MAGDYTRFRYNPLKDTTGVQMQQGRVLLDQDWNEYVQLQDRRWRVETMDIMGRAVVPIETPKGFEILVAGGNLTIGVGRMYVDGLLAENHGIDPADPPAKRDYDPILGELIGNSTVFYDRQPYFPNPPTLPTDTDPHLVYLDVWERELTYLEDPGLIDQAVAVDTGTRIQTVWQVKVLDNTPPGTSCSTHPETVPAWVTATAPSAGRLTTTTKGVFSSTDPCIVPANGGYRGSGNRCYRVEIHDRGLMGKQATFKWSRDNASVATAVTGINGTRDTLTVVLTKRDSVLRFQPNDWVEITDDFHYFQGLGGEMRQVASVDDVNLTIRLKGVALPANDFDLNDPRRHTRVIRWDQHGTVLDSLGNKIVDVDTNLGLIPVPAAGTTIVLEDGIQITFSIDGAMPVSQFNALDYWMFDARVIDASVEILIQSPPRGILHHYAWLGFVTFPSAVTDCRVLWPPPSEEGCDCTICVTEASHRGGKGTIQAAINVLVGQKRGGKICLGPGTYLIDTTVTISGGNAIRITGHGLPMLTATEKLKGNPIMRIDEGSTDITVEDLGMTGGLTSNSNQPRLSGLVLSKTFFVRVNRCEFRNLPLAVGLADFVTDTDLRGNFFNHVRVGVGDATPSGDQHFITSLAIEHNKMLCDLAGVALGQALSISGLSGVAFEGPRPHFVFSDIRFANNSVSSALGFVIVGTGLDCTVEDNTFQVFTITTGSPKTPGTGIFCTLQEMRISNNQIFGGNAIFEADGRNGIVLQSREMSAQVVGNRISTLAGTGILIPKETMLLQTIIAQNQLTFLGGGGIVMEIDSNSSAVDLNIVGNFLEDVVTDDPQPTDPSQVFAGIQLVSVSGGNVSDNTVLRVGSDLSVKGRGGIAVFSGQGVRIAGNRLADIGLTSALEGSGIKLVGVIGRVDVVDNEVRRAQAPAKGKSSDWTALSLESSDSNSSDSKTIASVRGNLLQSISSGSPMVIIRVGEVCVFNDNQCFLDGPTRHRAFGFVLLAASSVIASGNFLSGLAKQTAMSVNASEDRVTVVGNITSGKIFVNSNPLDILWAPLNVVI